MSDDLFTGDLSIAPGTTGNEPLTPFDFADFSKSPYLYNQRKSGMLGSYYPKSDVIGLASHVLAFDGREAYDKLYSVSDGPINPVTEKPYGTKTAKYKKWREEYIATERLTPLTADQSHAVESIAANLIINPSVATLISGATAKRYRTGHEFDGQEFELTYDVVGSGWWADFRTTSELELFEERSEYYGYWREWALLNAAFIDQNGGQPQAFVIAAEKENGNRAAVFLLDQHDLWEAQNENLREIHRYKTCCQSGVWPSGFENLRLMKRNKK